MKNLILIIPFLAFGLNAMDLPLNLANRHAGSTRQLYEVDKLIGMMVQFRLESDTADSVLTSGNGTFLMELPEAVNDRCDGFHADPPPHDSLYFDHQLQALSNYYEKATNGHQTFDRIMLGDVYQLPRYMFEYASSDTALGRLFAESVELARTELEEVFTENSMIVLFHAGIGQDFAIPFLDPTPWDLSSAFIDEAMLINENPVILNGFEINRGILLPETQNHLYYDAIEDIFYGETDFCDYQVGLTGTFAFLMGYALGLPQMFNIESGNPGVGIFGMMDQGSNNGRGVIPALPTAWTRILKGWTEPDLLTDSGDYQIVKNGYSNGGETIDQVYKLPISTDEYFLVENRNNWLKDEKSIDDIRRDQADNNIMAHWFDVVTEEMTVDQIQIDPVSQVILGFDHYDYGLPQSGLLIWHIMEPDPEDYFLGINNDRDHRAVHLEEADGAVDIGFESTALFVDPTNGWGWDMWYAGNDAFFYANPGEKTDNPFDLLIFDNVTSPNTRSASGAETFISLSSIGEAGDLMTFTYTSQNGLPVFYLSENAIEYVGNGYSAIDSTSAIYYIQDGNLFIVSAESEDSLPLADENIRVLTRPGCPPYSTIPSSDYHSSYLDENCQVTNSNLLPMGMIESIDLVTTADQFYSLGDIDGDSLDEMIEQDNGQLSATNINGTSANGFPVEGNFSGTPLIADINGDDDPEIIVREENDIIIFNATGKRIRTIASADPNSELALIPFWDKTDLALVDGNRLLLFPLNFDYCYWLNTHGQPSNEPMVTGVHIADPNSVTGISGHRVYNYPNPVTDDQTTFRYFVGSDVHKVSITIYDAAGFKTDELVNTDVTANEYNETFWNTRSLDSGLYFAEVKPDAGQSELVKVVIIRK